MTLFDGEDEKKELKEKPFNNGKNEEDIKVELYRDVPKEAYRLIEEVLRYIGALEKKSNIE